MNPTTPMTTIRLTLELATIDRTYRPGDTMTCSSELAARLIASGIAESIKPEREQRTADVKPVKSKRVTWQQPDRA